MQNSQRLGVAAPLISHSVEMYMVTTAGMIYIPTKLAILALQQGVVHFPQALQVPVDNYAATLKHQLRLQVVWLLGCCFRYTSLPWQDLGENACCLVQPRAGLLSICRGECYV